MDQKKKNLRLLLILIVLILFSVTLLLFPSGKKTTLKNPELFQVSDTASIDKIVIKSKTLDNELLRTDSGWVINRTYFADNNIMMVLLSVMKNVEIIRSIGENQKGEISERLDQSGILVNFYSGDENIRSFVAGANEVKTLSIFKSDDDEYFVVQLPGYESFVTGIFEIPAIDWRNRLIVSVGPTTLARLEITNYQKPEKSFNVSINYNIPMIEGIEDLDTIKLMDYLDQFSYFQADKSIDPESGNKYDSLLSMEPAYEFSFIKYDPTENVAIRFYPKIEDGPFIFAITSNGQNALFDFRRISGIFVDKQEFDKSIKKSR